jgi:hypothetical protein
MPKVINSIGLLCDIAGAYLILRFGLPAAISRTGATDFQFLRKDAEEMAQAKDYDKRSLIGFRLLILGFALQLASNFL